MKHSFKKIIRTAMLPVAFALTVTGCQKTQTAPPANISRETNAMNASTQCGSEIPGDLQVPAGNKLASQVYATGVQIYQVQRSATDPNSFKWVFIGPLATLYANEDFTNLTGTHYAGPSWEFIKGFNKGEKTVAKKSKEVTVDATAIPWLLLTTVDSLSSTGNKVTYIQRVCTTGGVAPNTGADEAHVGMYDSIPYTAVYLLYAEKR